MSDMGDPVITAHIKDLDSFQGGSTESTGWFDIDNDWFKRKISTLEPYFKKLLESLLKVKMSKHINPLYYRWIIVSYTFKYVMIQ